MLGKLVNRKVLNQKQNTKRKQTKNNCGTEVKRKERIVESNSEISEAFASRLNVTK